MKKFLRSKLLILLLLLTLFNISKSRKNKKEKSSIKDEYDSRHIYSSDIDEDYRRKNELDQRSCQDKIRKLIHKYNLNNGPTIDKDDYKRVFTRAFRMCFDELVDRSILLDANFDNSSFESLVDAIYYKLMERVDDEIPMEEAIGMFEPHTLLDTASEVFKALGYPNLVKEQIDKVMGTNKDSNDKKEKKDKKKKRRKDSNGDIVYDL